MRLISPTDAVVPLLELNEAHRPIKFLGTGFFVSGRSFLVTCNHVLGGTAGEIGFALMADLSEVHLANVVRRRPELDLAILQAVDYAPPNPLELGTDDEVHFNQLVVCLEYSQSGPSSGGITLDPASRVGNVTRRINYEPLGTGGRGALELSFPILRGASGAPVITNNIDYHVLGIVAHSIERELTPIQVYGVLDEANQLYEETRYLLPQGIAINVIHIRAALEELTTTGQ